MIRFQSAPRWKRDDRLQVAVVVRRARGTLAELPVVLNRHADQVGDGVLELHRETVGGGIRRLRLRPDRCRRKGQPQWPVRRSAGS